MGVRIKPMIAVERPCGNETLTAVAGSSAVGSVVEDSIAVERRRVRLPIVPGTISDHFAVRTFLSEIFGSTYAAEFQTALNDPSYRADHRLLLHRAGRIIAHAQMTRRMMQFGSLSLPVAGLQGLATAANCRGQGLGTHLLSAAEKHMVEAGALVGLLRTRVPHFFRRTGWALCGDSAGCSASPHAVLGRLLEQGLGLQRTARIQVRPWRRWEEESVARVYRQGLAGSYGTLERSSAYWHWLLERRAYDQFYVALDGPDLFDLQESSTRLVGYAAVKGDRIVELVTARERRKATIELLARTCGDAIEQDHRRIVLNVPAGSPALGFFCGEPQMSPDWNHEPMECCMARLLDPLRLMRVMCGVFAGRAKEAGLARPLELGLFVEGQKYQLEIADSVRVSRGTFGRSYLRLNVADFTRLLLGQLDWDRALEEGRVIPSTGLAREAGRALFPALPFWRPMLDDLRA
jgi:GNAT superfamily N-acetyltransferase